MNNKEKPFIPIEPIMDQIRQEIESKNKKNHEPIAPIDSGAPGEGVLPMTLDELRNKLNESWNVSHRPFTSHRPIIGPLIVLYKNILFKLVKMPLCNYLEDQTAFNAYVTQFINIFAEEQAQKEQIKHLLDRTDFLFTELDKKVETIDAKLQSAKKKQLQLDETILSLKYILQEEQAKLTQVNNSVTQLISTFREAREGLDSHTYNLFNEKFRDTIDVVKKRQMIYLDYFKTCKNIADLGCGRGEFLELLRENNIPAIGIDINLEMVESAKHRGLNVESGNLLEFLTKSPDASFDGIFSAQVIEHLTLSDIRKMLSLIYKKMKPNGYAIIETLNPLSFYSYSRNFLLDLTHQQPLHPQSLKFLMECSGFRDIKIKFTSIVPLEEMLEGIAIPQEVKPDQFEAWKKVNQSMNRLNELFFGWQEYAIIAKK